MANTWTVNLFDLVELNIAQVIMIFIILEVLASFLKIGEDGFILVAVIFLAVILLAKYGDRLSSSGSGDREPRTHGYPS